MSNSGRPDETPPRPPRSDDEAAYLAALGQRVRHMRALRGMSRKILARASGISERYIARLEGGQGNVSIALLRRVTRAMGLEPADLLAEDRGSPERQIVRDLLASAAPEQIVAAKAILTKGAAPQIAPNPARAPRVALIGLRGAGKSTIGRIVAERLSWPFVELNAEIERANGLSVAEIFAIYGQEGYRKFERDALAEISARPGPLVATTGGGIVAEPLTFDILLTSFFTVWLRATPEEHMLRVRRQGDLRPMADDRGAMPELRAILASREPLYARANVTVDTSGSSPAEAADRVAAAIERSMAVTT